MAQVLLYFCLAAMGFCVGGLALPKAAGVLVERAQARAASADAAVAADGGGIGTLSAGAGADGAAAACLGGDEDLRDAGKFSVTPGCGSSCRSSSGPAELSVAESRRVERLACAALTAAWSVLIAVLPMSVAGCMALWLCGLALIVAADCDLRSGLIPWETCAAMALSGLLFQAIVFGAEGVLSGFLSAFVILLVCFFAEGFAGRRGERAIGGGDVRCIAALALGSGQAAFMGFAASCLAAAFFGLLGVLAKRRSMKEGMPMAPFFLVWLVCLAICCMI